MSHKPTLARYHLIATATTGERITSATELAVEKKLKGSLGGVVQIAAEVAAGNILAVIFLVDPLANQSEPKPETIKIECIPNSLTVLVSGAIALSTG